MERQEQGQGSGERRAQGEGVERGGIRNRRNDGRMERSQRNGRLGWAPGLGGGGAGGAGGQPGPGVWALALLLALWGWLVWAHKPAGVRPPGNLPVCHRSPPRLGHALASHLALRTSALHAHQNAQKRLRSPAPRLLPAPCLLPGRPGSHGTYPTKVRTSGGLLQAGLGPPLATPLFPVFLLLLHFSLPLTSPSHPGEGFQGLGCRHPSLCVKPQGLTPKARERGVGVCLPTHLPARMWSSPGCASLGPYLIQRYTLDP